MVNYKFYILISSIVFGVCSCSQTPKIIKKNFTFCHSDIEMNINSIIDNDGFYVVQQPLNKTPRSA